MPEDADKLIAHLYKTGGRAPLKGFATVQSWVNDQQIRPGRGFAVTPSDMYRHYIQWCGARRYRPIAPQLFFRVFARMGFVKGRKKIDGHDVRPYGVDAYTASMLRDWVRRNPAGENGQIVVPGGPKRKNALLSKVKELEAAGA